MKQPRPSTPIVETIVVTFAVNNVETVTVKSPKNHKGERVVTEFEVDRDLLRNKSKFFSKRSAFTQTNSHDGKGLEDDDTRAMYIFFAYIHDIDSTNLWTRPTVQAADIGTVWHLINICDKYCYDGKEMKDFFDQWYVKNVDIMKMEAEFACQLALPCFFFAHPLGFAEITYWLAMNHKGHIREYKPKSLRGTHLKLGPPDFVGPVNHARGSLKSCLQRALDKRLKRILERGESGRCDKWTTTAGLYFHALSKAGAWPLNDYFQHGSVTGILKRLKEDFEMTTVCDCRLCDKDWDQEMRDIINEIASYFEGLCLQCMDRSQQTKGNTDKDYWRHLGVKHVGTQSRWDADCDLIHGQNTWYISWLGRDEYRRKLLNMARGNGETDE